MSNTNLTKEEALAKIKELEQYIEGIESKNIHLLGGDTEYYNPKTKRGHVLCKYDEITLIQVDEGLAPKELMYNCFILGDDFNWEIKEHNGIKLLIPTIK